MVELTSKKTMWCNQKLKAGKAGWGKKFLAAFEARNIFIYIIYVYDRLCLYDMIYIYMYIC